MTPTRTTDDRTLTAEEFLAEYGHLSGVELVRGMVVWEGQEVTTTVTDAPELAVLCRSSSGKWSAIYAKVGEYLAAGVTVVLVLDPHTESASVFRPDELQQIFHNGDEFTLPDVLPGFAILGRRFFEG